MRSSKTARACALVLGLLATQGCGPVTGDLDGASGDASSDARSDVARDGRGETGAPDAPPICTPGLVVSPSYAAAQPGQTVQFTATYTSAADCARTDVSARVTWASSLASVATVTARGLVTAIRVGSVFITANYEGLPSNEARFEVVNEGVPSITLDPTTLTINLGELTPRQIIATGVFSDGMRRSLNDEMGILWSSSAPDVASVDAQGRVMPGSRAGTALITAQLGGVSSSPCVVSVNPAVTDRALAVTPAMTSLVVGRTARFAATVTSTDGATRDVSSEAEWSIEGDAASLGTGENRSVATGLGPGTARVTARYGALTATVMLAVDALEPASIVLEPATFTVSEGSSQLLRVNAALNDGSARELVEGVTFATSNVSVAEVRALAGGGYAVFGHAPSATPVTITASVPRAGGRPPLTATAMVLVTGESRVELIARLREIGSLHVRSTAQIIVSAQLPDGSVRALTDDPGVTYASADPAIASVSPSGTVTGVGRGSTTITVSYRGQTTTVRVDVIFDGVLSIALVPRASLPRLRVGQTLAFEVVGTMSDGSTRGLGLEPNVQFRVSDDAVATIANSGAAKGTLTARAPGRVRVQASFTALGGATPLADETTEDLVIDPAAPAEALEVTCTRLDVDGAVPLTAGRLVAGQRAQCGALVRAADGSTRQATGLAWSAVGAGSIDDAGVVRAGMALGSLEVTASLGAQRVTQLLSVHEGRTPVLSLAVRDTLPVGAEGYALVPGLSARLVARAVYTYRAGGASVTEGYDVTEASAWASSEPTRVRVSNSSGSRGRVTGGDARGASMVLVAFDGEFATLTFETLSYELRAMRVGFGAVDGANDARLRIGESARVFARGEYCPASRPSLDPQCRLFDVSALASVASNSPSTARVESTGGRATVHALGEGNCRIHATLSGLESEGSLVVTR